MADIASLIAQGPQVDFSALTNLPQAYLQGNKLATDYRQQQAMQRAGVLLGSGDYNTAAKELLGSGKISEGLALLKLGQERQNGDVLSSSLTNLYGGNNSTPGGASGPSINVAPTAPQNRAASESLWSNPGANGWTVNNVNGQNVAFKDAQGKDIPSPLDPPSPVDRARMAALTQAEGTPYAANVIRNRAVESGLAPTQVMTQPGQFEPVSSGAVNKYGPGTKGYDQALAAVDNAYAGNDPTKGAVNFYAPGAQAALASRDGRPSVAKFDNGNGQDIGSTRFFSRADGGATSADAVSSQKVQPQAQPPQTFNDIGNARLQQLIQIAARPNLTKEQQDTVNKLIQAETDQSKIPDEIKKYHYAVKQGYKGTFEAWQEASDNRKQQKVTVNAFANPLVKGIADRYNSVAESAATAPQSVQSIHDARQQLDDGIFSGAGSDVKLTVAKIGAALGFDIPNDPIAATEAFRSTMGNRVLQSLKVLGTNPSNTDRIFAEKIAGGDIALDEKSIRRLLAIDERNQREIIRRNNRYADSLSKAAPDEVGPYGGLMRVEEPGQYSYKPAEKAGLQPQAPQPAGKTGSGVNWKIVQ